MTFRDSIGKVALKLQRERRFHGTREDKKVGGNAQAAAREGGDETADEV